MRMLKLNGWWQEGLEVKLTGEVMADGRFEISGNNIVINIPRENMGR
jgi:hypothetical protein